MKWFCAALSMRFTNSIFNSGVSIPRLAFFWKASSAKTAYLSWTE